MVTINRKKSKAIDFHDLVTQLEAKHGFSFYDMADRSKKVGEACRVRGIDHPTWHGKQFAKMTPLELEVKAISDAIPYQNVWHWLTDNDFEDLERGDKNYLDLSEERLADEDLPEYVEKFLRILRDELNAQGVTEDEVEFYIDY